MKVGFDFLFLVESVFCRLQGKGWGAGTVEREVGFARRALKGKDVRICVDVGANVGKYADVVLRAFPSCKLVLFEPSANNVEILEKRFGGVERVKVVGAGLASEAGEVRLFANHSGSSLGSLTKRNLDYAGVRFDYEESVEVLRFEDFWKESLESARVEFVKLDVEGHELSVLRGFGAAIEFVDVIQFEFGGANVDTRTYFRDFWEFFSAKGFGIYRMTPIGLSLVRNYRISDESFRISNYLAVRGANKNV